MEAFLKGGGLQRSNLAAQELIHKGIVQIAYKIKGCTTKQQLPLLKKEITELNAKWPAKCQVILLFFHELIFFEFGLYFLLEWNLL